MLVFVFNKILDKKKYFFSSRYCSSIKKKKQVSLRLIPSSLHWFADEILNEVVS